MVGPLGSGSEATAERRASVITAAQITKRAHADGVDAKTVERDYVLAHIVSLISRKDTGKMMVFKGGTSLRLLHFDDYRYSADLDYSVTTTTCEQAHEFVRGALAGEELESIKNLQLIDKDDTKRVSYIGPLGAERSVKLDIADDELVEHTELGRLRERWPDVPDVPVLVYTRLEVTAEKLRCILQRFQCRDLLDLSLLFEDGVDLVDAAALFTRKATHRELDPASFERVFEERMPRYKKAWERELEHYISEAPHFDELERGVRRALRKTKLIR